MRTLRLSLAGTVTLMLLGGLSGAVMAQGEDSMRPGAANIIYRLKDFVSDGTVQVKAPNKYERGVHVLLTFESSDPRLSGDVTYLGNLDVFSDGSSVHTETYEVVNDGGRWFGTAMGMEVPDKVYGDFVLLRGEGDYAGLSALLFVDGSSNEANGSIFPGELPPVPEPPAE